MVMAIIIITSAKEVLNMRPFVFPSVCKQIYTDTIRPIILKKFNSKGIYVT